MIGSGEIAERILAGEGCGRVRRRFTAWNRNRQTVGWRSRLWLDSLPITAVWLSLTYFHVADLWFEDWPSWYRSLSTWWDGIVGKPAFVAYVWTALFGGATGV